MIATSGAAPDPVDIVDELSEGIQQSVTLAAGAAASSAIVDSSDEDFSKFQEKAETLQGETVGESKEAAQEDTAVTLPPIRPAIAAAQRRSKTNNDSSSTTPTTTATSSQSSGGTGEEKKK